MEKLYDRIDWVNNTTPALNQTNLNRMSKALDDLDDRVVLIAGDILVTVPELREMLENCTELEQRLEAMTENPPYIGDNGHWYIWDTDTGAYVDSGIDASITVEIADITMLEPNATPYVTNTGTDTDPIFHLFIPRGQPGKGISSISKTGTSGYVDTYTITYTDGTTTTYTVTNGRNTDQVSTIPTASASLVGTIYQYIGESTSSYTHGFYYECVNDGGVYKWVNIPVGNDPVAITSTDPYTYRQGKGNLADIEIDGASVGWNQLVANSGTVSVTVPSGHKYLSKISGSWSISQSSGTAISSLVGGTDMIINLTQAFNPTIADAIYAMEQASAGAGVAFFRKYFSKDYYAYDPGSIQSVCVGSRKVVGFNQWDEEWELGTINSSGNNELSSSRIRSKNYIPIIGGLVYYIKNMGLSSGRAAYYDKNENFIEYVTDFPTGGSSSGLVIPPTNASYLRFSPNTNYGTTYKHDICINISDPDRNGTYEPYTSITYPFDSTKQIRGMFDLVNGELKANGDKYWSDGNIQRNWRDPVDLGTLTWNYNSTTMRFGATLPTHAKDYVSDTNYAKAICSKKYTVSPLPYRDTDRTDLQLLCNGGYVTLRDFAYTDAAVLKSSLSGTYLTYERKTLTTEAAQPYQNPQRAYIDGTEEFTDGLTRDVMIPVGNNTTYQQDKILPSIEDYVDAVAQQKSDISAIGTNEDKATASQAYTVGQHFYKDGKFCTVIANIASGGTFTLNTNYVEGTIAEAIESIQNNSGHTILNSSGTAMTQRGKLQFNGATVTDDSANDKTIVTTTPQSMIGDAWASGQSYAVGDYRIDGNVLYKCKTAHTSSASNRPPYASYWDAVSVASELQASGNKLILPHLFYRGYSNTTMGSMTGISGHSGKSLSVVDDYLTGGNAGNAWYGTYFSNPVNLSDCNRIYVEIENTAIIDSSTSAMYQLMLFNTTPVWNGGYVASVIMDRQGDSYAINYSQGTHIFCKDLSSFSASQKANTYVGIGFFGNSTNSHIKQIWVA